MEYKPKKMKTDKEKISRVFKILNDEFGYEPEKGLFLAICPDGQILTNVLDNLALTEILNGLTTSLLDEMDINEQ
jgi:hypothetical protein